MENEIISSTIPVDKSKVAGDALICYCFGLSANQLREAYSVHGSLARLEKATKVGSACTGCKAMLSFMFNEAASDHYHIAEQASSSSLCRKPGYKVMKGLVVATDKLDSRIVSSNAVAPQFENCDSTSTVRYALLDQNGNKVTRGEKELATNELFSITTESLDIPRPFVGIFILHYDRSNMGASRFNIQWYGKGAGFSSTHECASTGRPHATLPMIIDRKFLDGPNTVYLGIMNPHDNEIPVQLVVRDIDKRTERKSPALIASLNSTWINANESIFKPALDAAPEGRFTFRLDSLKGMHNAATVYFFVHNRNTQLWTAQHL